MQQTEKYWNLINRIVLSAISVMAMVGIVLAFTPKIKQIQDYQKISDSWQQRIDQKISDEQDLKEKQRRFLSDPAFVERVAHEVGYARRDEIIFHFPEETGVN